MSLNFQLTENESYSTVNRVPSNVPAAKAPWSVPVKKEKMKCFMVAIVMATILNFLLVIVFGATLFYFQTNLTQTNLTQTNLTAEVIQLTQDIEGQSGMTCTGTVNSMLHMIVTHFYQAALLVLHSCQLSRNVRDCPGFRLIISVPHGKLNSVYLSRIPQTSCFI